MSIETGPTLTMTNCSVSVNSAGVGGGGVFIHANSGTATLTDCTVSGNSTTGNTGGGVYNKHMCTLTDCTVSGNSAGFGGGGVSTGGSAYDGDINISGTTTLTNCTISGNSTGGEGGGVENLIFKAAIDEGPFMVMIASLQLYQLQRQLPPRPPPAWAAALCERYRPSHASTRLHRQRATPAPATGGGGLDSQTPVASRITLTKLHRQTNNLRRLMPVAACRTSILEATAPRSGESAPSAANSASPRAAECTTARVRSGGYNGIEKSGPTLRDDQLHTPAATTAHRQKR